MRDLGDRTAVDSSRRSRWLALRVLGWAILGGFLLIVISLPLLADESNSPAPVGYYIAIVVLFAAVASRIYVILRRAAVSRTNALVVAVMAIPGIYFVTSFTYVGIANAAS